MFEAVLCWERRFIPFGTPCAIRRGEEKSMLNLADVDYIDSSGMLIAERLPPCGTAGGELKLLNLTQKVHDVLHVTELLVHIRYSRRCTAVKSFDYYFAK